MPKGKRKSRAGKNRFRYRYYGQRISEEESQKRQALFPISTGAQHLRTKVLLLEQQLMEFRNKQPSSTITQTNPVRPSNPVKDIEVIDLELEILTSTVTQSTSVTWPNNMTPNPPNSHVKNVGLTDIKLLPRASTQSKHVILPGIISNTHSGSVKEIEVVDVELEYETSFMSLRGSQVPTTIHSVNHHVQHWINSIQNPNQLADGPTDVIDTAVAGLSTGTPIEGESITGKPLTGGKGMCLLQKMGWKTGEGLGKNSEGMLEPVTVKMKKNKKGLATQEELEVLSQVLPQIGPHSAANPKLGKKWSGHPLGDINEFCILKGYGLPEFELVCQDHSRPTQSATEFMYSVLVNGIVYTPTAGSTSKKSAKREAATICLRANGVYTEVQ